MPLQPSETIPAELVMPDLKKMDKNIFVAIEAYLNNPTQYLANIIKQLSHDLTNQAYENAKIRFPDKIKRDANGQPILDNNGQQIANIGADEYGPILYDMITIQAKEAMSYSTRMFYNADYDEAADQVDRPYIFRVTQAQQMDINKLIGELLKPTGGKHLHPDGLIFAFDGYIERRSSSKFKPLQGNEAIVFDHNAKLYLKSKELVKREAPEVADIVAKSCAQIKGELSLSQNKEVNYSNIKGFLVALKKNPKVQEHRGYLKTVVTNFLLIISGFGALYLAATAGSRGTFFYQPKTATEQGVENFENNVGKVDNDGPD